MTFLHPWAIGLGALAVAVPLLVYYLARPRPVRIQLSTVRFVQEIVRKRRSMYRWRNALIVALRMLAAALLALAFARPWIDGEPAGDVAGTCRVVILDVSQSMAGGENGISAFERARALAAGYLERQAGLKTGLVLAGAQAWPVLPQCSSDPAIIVETLGDAKVLPEQMDVEEAIAAAGNVLAQTPVDADGRRELVIISDFQRSNWNAISFAQLPADVVVQARNVSPGKALSNLAVLDVAKTSRAECDRPIRIEVEIGNFSPGPRDVQIDLDLADASYRLEGRCSPNAATTLATDVILRDAGWHSGTARLLDAGDALPADDLRTFVINVRPRPICAFVTSQLLDAGPSSSYFLKRALSPSGSELSITHAMPDQLTPETLTPADLIVLDHPGPLPDQSINLLADLMRRGRSLLYVTANPSDATNLDHLIAAVGHDIQMPVAFAAPAPGQHRQSSSLAGVVDDEPPFGVFGDHLSAMIEPLRFGGGLVSRRLEVGLRDDVLAVYDDGSACLIMTTCGAGALAVLNADLTMSNLPASPAFVPIVNELVDHLAGPRDADNIEISGEPVARCLPADITVTDDLTARGPGATGELIEQQGRVQWRWQAAGSPGVYEITRNANTVFALATGVSPAESDLSSLDESALAERFAGQRTLHYGRGEIPREGADDAWVWLAVACMVCACVELIVLKVFRA